MKKELDYVNEVQKEVILLNQGNALLGWDEEVYLPEKGVHSRSEQSSFLSKLSHEAFTSEKFFESLKKLRKSDLLEKDKVMVEKLYKDVVKSRKLPSSFVRELSKEISLAGDAWRRARKKKDFKVFQDNLNRIVKLKRKEAELIGLPGHPYNSLLDDYEEGMSAEKLKPIFEELKRDLLELIDRIKSSERYGKQISTLMKRKFDREKMYHYAKDAMWRMGLQKDSTRIDLSEHPFTTKIGQGDVRITTNFRKDPMFSFSSTIHEAGHALYEQNLPEKDQYNILGDAPSLGIHESQSRFWENMIGKGKPFWRYYYKKFKRDFNLPGTFQEWHDEVNLVRPGKIRIESDEVHYCLHVILRFEIELGLIDGTIRVCDLPGVWNRKMKEFFGVKIENDVEGVLQDVHWSMGSLGYFPTYAIGTMYAAQLYDALRKEHKNIEKDIEKGDFSKISEWLKEKVHRHGSRYLSEEIIKKVCGEGLNPKVYVNYLNEKYGKIYGF